MYHTQILAGTGEPVTTDHPSDGYEAILTDANTARDVAIIARGSTGVVYTRQFYQELLDRFSSLDKLVVGLVTITLRVRKVSPNAIEFNSAKAQVWDRLIRSSQKHFPQDMLINWCLSFLRQVS